MKLLFVCLGNICRSPSAEAIMQSLVDEQGYDNKIFCDSAGTSAYHVGEPADRRMQRFALERGYSLLSRSRQFCKDDFQEFDYIFAMDKNNFYDMKALDSTGEFEDKLFLMTDFCKNHNVDGVPDPYYGGDNGFRLVIDILEDACSNALEFILRK